MISLIESLAISWFARLRGLVEEQGPLGIAEWPILEAEILVERRVKDFMTIEEGIDHAGARG